MHTCPICGFDQLPVDPLNPFERDYEICPCCGCEFGNDNAGPGNMEQIHRDLRYAWIVDGMRWWYPNERPPLGWNPVTQLQKLLRDKHEQ